VELKMLHYVGPRIELAAEGLFFPKVAKSRRFFLEMPNSLGRMWANRPRLPTSAVARIVVFLGVTFPGNGDGLGRQEQSTGHESLAEVELLMNKIFWSVAICVFACGPSGTDAQDTVEELLEMATPRWLSARESAYYELGIRVEELREHQEAGNSETKRFRNSRDLFASGDLKLINTVSLDPELPVDRSETTWDDEHVFMRKSTAQNAKYGFVVERDLKKAEHRDLWRMKDQVIWPKKPEWQWLETPLPTVAPIDSTLMRGLALDPRLGVLATTVPLEEILGGFIERGVVERISHRDGNELGRVVTVNWTNMQDNIDKSAAAQGAVEYRSTVQVELLPEQEWRLLSFEMRFDFLDANEKVVVVRKWSTKIDYKPGSTLPPYRVTVEEDTARGLFNTVRQFRSLTEAEKASLRKLCYLSGFQLPEPEGPPAEAQ